MNVLHREKSCLSSYGPQVATRVRVAMKVGGVFSILGGPMAATAPINRPSVKN